MSRWRATVVSFSALFLRAAVFFARNVTVCRTVSILAQVKPAQYPVAGDGMLAEVGFNRDLAGIDWQLELRPLFCSFWRHRIPPLRSHLLTPILDLCLAVGKFRCLAI